MKIRLSALADLPVIMKIIADAQRYLSSQNIDQWQDGYPTEAQIRLDIKNEDSYVVVDDANQLMSTTVFTTKPESTYQKIEGEWLTNNTAIYGVIHRLAVGDNYRKLGLAKFVFKECEDKLIDLKIASMRIDTHHQNLGMQHLLKKMGYTYCGLIYLGNGDERLAFEKIL